MRTVACPVCKGDTRISLQEFLDNKDSCLTDACTACGGSGRRIVNASEDIPSQT